MMIRKLCAVTLGGTLLCTALIAAQKSSNSVPANFPLSLWMERRQVTQIPWSVFVGKPYFRSDLRQELQIGASIRPVDLEKSGDTHDLVFFVRVLDGATHVTPIQPVAPRFTPQPPVAPTPVRGGWWTQIALVRPGKYKLELAVLDRATGLYSTRYESVSVPGNENDPLEQALRGFPRFEFVETAKPEYMKIPVRYTSPGLRGSVPNLFPNIFTSGSRPTVMTAGDLGVSIDPLPSFVVNRPRKLHLSVMTILSPPERALENEYSLSVFQSNLTNFLSAFSRLDVTLGTANLTGVDLKNRTLVFDRKDLKEVTREMIDGAMSAIEKDSSTVSVEALAGSAVRGRFFRDVLRKRFEEAEKETEDAEHVIVLVGARSDFPKGPSVMPLTPERDCHCRVIYVRFALEPLETDDMDSLLKAYKPRVFEPLDWQEFRNNFATIYEQLLR